MRADEDGLPQTGASGRYLGTRPGGRSRDLDVEEGMVRPGGGGLSVSPPPPGNLPGHRRPPEHGGFGQDPAFEMETDEPSEELRYRPDPANPDSHGFIEPARVMSFEDYQRALYATRTLWRRV